MSDKNDFYRSFVGHGRGRHDWLGLLIKVLKQFTVFCSPRSQSICAAAVYNGCSRRWTCEFNITREDQEPVFLGKRSNGSELLTLCDGVWVALCRWAFPQYGSGSLKNNKAVCCTLASPLCTLNPT